MGFRLKEIDFFSGQIPPNQRQVLKKYLIHYLYRWLKNCIFFDLTTP
ncbi:hypothetical protein GARC_3874 [Paraglaciecola arctica BSs20135]|uniref:Uncharacterized protein n=1 Tax=Paraglaciecola arctica BSs20135 TaxID=493475 RepID=K6YRQ7_9ALTE|nr:hypothetical protein GARC_3874 [Paraglaciecola arctica BSs20135]